MSRFARSHRVSLPVVLVLASVLIAACYEIPPRVPSDLKLTPPPAAYVEDPYHPASLFLQRAFGRRGSSRTLVPRDPADSLPPSRPWNTVDCVEVLAILDELDPLTIPDPVRRAVFRADAVALAATLKVTDDSPHAKALCREVLNELLRVGLAP